MSEFKVPEATLKQLGEFSGGGFILFIYDENGTPRTYASFDSAAHGLGMQKFMQNWLNLVDSVNLENSIESIQSHNDDDNEEDK